MTSETFASQLTEWLAERFKEERSAAERRHEAVLADLQSILGGAPPNGSFNGSGRSSQLSQLGTVAEDESVPPPYVRTRLKMKRSLAKWNLKHAGTHGTLGSFASLASSQRAHQSPLSLKDSLSVKAVAGLPFWHPTRMVRSYAFELFFSFLILLQAVTMAVEVQFTGLDWGYQLGYEGYDRPAAEVWTSVPAVVQGIDVFFGVLFTIEVVLKSAVLRRAYVLDPWSWFDMVLVALWCMDTGLSLLPLDSHTLRLLRLVRLIRLVKLVRAVQGFDSLIIMTTALRDSVNALFWVAMIMLVVEMMFALLLNQVLMSLVRGAGLGLTAAEERTLFEYFGTFPRAMLTMFQFTLGTWVPVARILQEVVSPYFNIFSILHKVTVGFACIGVINGVFMQETLKVAQSDDVIMMRDVARREKIHASKMKDFFRYADHSKDYVITREEWQRVMEGTHAQHWFEAQGLNVEDANTVFSLIDRDNSQTITMHELIKGVNQLKGPARSLDLVMMTERHNQLMDQMTDLLERWGGGSPKASNFFATPSSSPGGTQNFQEKFQSSSSPRGSRDFQGKYQSSPSPGGRDLQEEERNPNEIGLSV